MKETNTKNNGIEKEVLREYVLRIENSWVGSKKEGVVMDSVYTRAGEYVGQLSDVDFYFKKGILPEAYDNNRVCSIGKSHIDGKWYGWSHRAMYGFEVGMTVKEGDCTAESLPIGFVAETEADCKKMAEAFASSVS